MSQYSHHVSGIFSNRIEAESTLNALIKSGIPGVQLEIFDSDCNHPLKSVHS